MSERRGSAAQPCFYYRSECYGGYGAACPWRALPAPLAHSFVRVIAMADPNVKLAPVEAPRDIANKSHRTNLLRAIRMALDIQSPAVRHNTQTLNSNRYRATAIL